MLIYDMTFQLGRIASAIGRKPETLKTWLHQGVLIGHRDVSGGGGPGQRREFSWFNCMEFAIASELLKVTGLSVSAAFKAAGDFAHSADGPLPGETLARLPGLPFETPVQTYLAATAERSEIFAWLPGIDILPRMMSELGWPTAFSVIDVRSVFDQLCSGLGLNPEEALATAYARQKSQV